MPALLRIGCVSGCMDLLDAGCYRMHVCACMPGQAATRTRCCRLELQNRKRRVQPWRTRGRAAGRLGTRWRTGRGRLHSRPWPTPPRAPAAATATPLTSRRFIVDNAAFHEAAEVSRDACSTTAHVQATLSEGSHRCHCGRRRAATVGTRLWPHRRRRPLPTPRVVAPMLNKQQASPRTNSLASPQSAGALGC